MGDDQDQGVEGEATSTSQFTTNAHDLQEAAKLQARLSSQRNNEQQQQQQQQQQQSQTTATTSNESIHYQDTIQSVSLDEGAYKYVLITAIPPNNNNNNNNNKNDNTKTRTFVYSKRNAEYHRNVAESLLPALEQCGYTDVRIKGGGRILRDDKRRRVHIFGYSYGFGRADHATAKKVVEGCVAFGGYEVTWSNDGY